MITKKEEEAILKKIWDGIYTVTNLPHEVYFENKDKLHSGIEEGFGNVFKRLKQSGAEFVTMQSLKDNTTFFSAAKTFQQVNDMSFLRFDENGFIRSFRDFEKDAGKVFNTYNRDWLETEFNTSIAQSESAARWSEIQATKGDLPMLQYQTASDERVRDEHTAWDNIIRPADDSFWDTRMPPNGYNCRCTVIQLPSGNKSSLKGVPKNSAPMFADNSGKSAEVFKEKGKGSHPYFDAPQKLKKKNFGLPE